ncbi:MAG: AarF/UbiB family protein [Proteobacteria bacterium]|nr:AarF/UbiB family protein [Pseudomonadota bacterium]
MRIYSIYITYKNIRRLKEIVSILIKHGFAHFVERTEIRRYIPLTKRFKIKQIPEEKIEVRLRKVLEELGPTFVKFGQMLARRYDILPARFINELSKLEDKVEPMEEQLIEKIIQRNYGNNGGSIFKSIDRIPFAAASIAQVHRAILNDGTLVVLKIKRENIDEVVEDDLRILFFIAKILEDYFPELKRFSIQELVKEFSKSITKELNFLNEVVNIEKLRHVFRDSEDLVIIPKVYRELSNQDIIVIEYIESTKITEIKENEELSKKAEELMLSGVEVFLKKVFDTGFFHGDLHPGNVGISVTGKIVLYDFGNVGFLLPETSKILKSLLSTLITKNYKDFVDLLIFLGWFKDEVREIELKRDLAEVFEWRTELNLGEIDLISLIRDIINLVQKYNVYLPFELLSFFRTVLLMDSIGKSIVPNFSINKIIREVLKSELMKEMSIKDNISNFIEVVGEYKKLIERTPYKIDKIINKMLNDKFTVDFVHVNLEPLIIEMAKTGNKVSVSLIVSALIIGTALVFFSDKGPHVFGYPILGILGFVSASVLGIYLLIRIIFTRRL